jgi:hypothetical protein
LEQYECSQCYDGHLEILADFNGLRGANRLPEPKSNRHYDVTFWRPLDLKRILDRTNRHNVEFGFVIALAVLEQQLLLLG